MLFHSKGPVTELALKLLETVPSIRKFLVAQLRQQGIEHSIPQLQILERISEHPRTVSELAELQNVTKPTMSATLSRMAKQDLIRRERALEDQRVVMILATEKGQAISQNARQKATAILDALVSNISPEDQDRLTDGLELLISAVEHSEPSHPTE